MEIKRIIVVGEIVSNCFECDFCLLLGGNYICDIKHTILNKQDIKKSHPVWCPLEVENECVWVLNVDYTTSCGEWIDSDIQNMHDCTFGFCPNCGKHIRYEEEE